MEPQKDYYDGSEQTTFAEAEKIVLATLFF